MIPELKCFEKARNWGGQWNYTWRTGTDEFGEVVSSSQYRNLWTNAPAECREFPDYTMEHHFGKPIPSFPPRPVVIDYLEGRWKQADVRSYIQFCHAVKDVCYNPKTDDFTVLVKDLENDVILDAERFDYVVVSSGHYSTPNAPSFAGIEGFPGHVSHSHDFRDANSYSGQNVLIIGASHSAEDIALQLVKYGAKSVICSWRTRPMEYKFPSQVQERPLLLRLEGKTTHFKDGTSGVVDAIIMCTGYMHNYPFLRENLRLKSANSFYPPDLYKGIVWAKGGNGKLLYVSSQNNTYTFSMFDAQAMWSVKLIQGEIRLPSCEAQEEEWTGWVAKLKIVTSFPGMVDFQTDYIKYIVDDLGSDYPYDLDVSEAFKAYIQSKKDNNLTYRDQSYLSKATGLKSPKPKLGFMEAFDDSLESFINQ